MSLKDNINQAFEDIRTLVEDQNINIVETFVEGKWDSIYICASRHVENVPEDELFKESKLF